MQWLRRSFIAGFFVIVPLAVSVAALVWFFGIIDSSTAPVSERLIGRRVPGLGLIVTAALVLLVGTVATNVIGRKLLSRAEDILSRVPVFRTVYGPVRQLVAAFAPDNEYGFKQVVLVEDPRRGLTLGFLTKEFTVERGQGPEPFVAVYVPTNHLYLGDIALHPRAEVLYPDISVEDGIRIVLTGGMSLPDTVSDKARRRG
ncbi:MAG: DUF502 domain-containing protein [Vicinamibacterales bacterium]|nr:DUF502 domain-containing protein [Vicinamibacterales bacterium]